MKSEDRPVRGTKAIAHELGISPATFYRLKAKGGLPVTKGGCGGRTSPIYMDRKDIHRLKPGRDD